MIGWRETRWFRASAVLLIALLSGGLTRVVLGLVVDSGAADGGAAVVAGAVLFGLIVRRAMRRFREENPKQRHLRAVDLLDEDPADIDWDQLLIDPPEDPQPK